MIETKHLVFKGFLSYPDLVFSDDRMSFIVGDSGVGKSALLRMINGSVDADRKSLFLDGSDINDLDPIELRKDYLLCGQSVFLFPGTIYENFAKFYTLRDQVIPSDDAIREFLELVCLPVSIDASLDTMSGGERQRVYLAIFISLARKTLLLDEPTSALDKATAGSLLTNLRRYCETQSLKAIIISHDNDLAHEFADEIIDLNHVSRGEF